MRTAKPWKERAMTRLSAIAVFLATAATVAQAADDRLAAKRSPHSVAVTLDRLAEAVTARGIGIAARIDHAAAAQKAGQSLKPTQVLIFGNPKLGTPLMQSNRRIGLDLPMRVLAWEDDGGQVWVAYVKPEALKSDHAIADRDGVFGEMAQALDKLTDEAVKPK
jgi:uncharacterized protein (DUF302 family)